MIKILNEEEIKKMRVACKVSWFMVIIKITPGLNRQQTFFFHYHSFLGQLLSITLVFEAL